MKLRSIVWTTVMMFVLVAGTGCPTDPGTNGDPNGNGSGGSDEPNGSNGSNGSGGATAGCNAGFTDEGFGVSLSPPEGSEEPVIQDNETLRIVAIQTAAGVTPAIVLSLSFPNGALDTDVATAADTALQVQRELLTDNLGHTILTDEPRTLASGNEGHILTSSSDDGQDAAVAVLARGTDRYALVFLLGSDEALENMLASGLTLCVE